MADVNINVTTTAGVFTTLNSQWIYYIYPPHIINGNKRYNNTRYAVGVGIVIENMRYFGSSPDYLHRKLVRHHIN